MKNRTAHNLWWWRKKYRRERKVRKQEEAAFIRDITQLRLENKELKRQLADAKEWINLLKSIGEKGILVTMDTYCNLHAVSCLSFNMQNYQVTSREISVTFIKRI